MVALVLLALSPLLAIAAFCVALLWSVQLLGWASGALMDASMDELSLVVSGWRLLALPRLWLGKRLLAASATTLDAQTGLTRWGCLQLDRVIALIRTRL